MYGVFIYYTDKLSYPHTLLNTEVYKNEEDAHRAANIYNEQAKADEFRTDRALVWSLIVK